MKTFGLISALCSALLLGSVAVAGADSHEEAESDFPGEFAAGVTFTSDYTFRGISQTAERPAIQGSIDWSHESGFYVGTWASNVQFGDTRVSMEWDFYAGYAGELGPIGFDIGVLYYWYPGDTSALGYSFFEVPFSLSMGFLEDDQLEVFTSMNYSPSYFARSSHAIYVGGGVSWSLPWDLPLAPSLDGAAYYQWIDEEADFGAPSYVDWQIGLGLQAAGFDLDVRYIDTNLSKGECFGGSTVCSPRVTGSISRSF